MALTFFIIYVVSFVSTYFLIRYTIENGIHVNQSADMGDILMVVVPFGNTIVALVLTCMILGKKIDEDFPDKFFNL